MIQDYWHGLPGNWTDFTFVLSTCNKLFIDEKNIWIIFWGFTKGDTIDSTISVVFFWLEIWLNVHGITSVYLTLAFNR